MKTTVATVLVLLASLTCVDATAESLVSPAGGVSTAHEDESVSSNGGDSLQTVAKDFYITPYIGESTLVGNLGLELQHKHMGYNIGIFKNIIAIDNSLCAGVKYYTRPRRHSWVFGIGGGIALDEPGPDEELCGGWSGEIPDDWTCGTGSVVDMYV
ncbi:hypothetical protein ACFL6M_06605, partial [Candidatus Eisenbacteria bacterium]